MINLTKQARTVCRIDHRLSILNKQNTTTIHTHRSNNKALTHVDKKTSQSVLQTYG
ncbi:MAG: hypothetical protein IT497_01040 [Ottowia sp.]|nr:hypothetical protein [Ottowia sp.]